MQQAAPYSNISKQCLLRLHEKLDIALYANPEELLNKRSEMIFQCHYLNKFLLMSLPMDIYLKIVLYYICNIFLDYIQNEQN